MRKFRVDASKKIQAAIDYDSEENIFAIAIESDIGTFADNAFHQIETQINTRMQQYLDHPDSVDQKTFCIQLYRNCQYIPEQLKEQQSSVFPYIYYCIEELPEATWIYFEPKHFTSSLYDEFLDGLYSAGVYTDRGNFDVNPQDSYAPILMAPKGGAVVASILYCMKEQGVTNLPNGLDLMSDEFIATCEQFINEYCDFILAYCNACIDKVIVR